MILTQLFKVLTLQGTDSYRNSQIAPEMCLTFPSGERNWQPALKLPYGFSSQKFATVLC